jgi:hypothetical protein
MDNKHIQVIPETVLTQVQTKINEAQSLINPYLLALTPEERQALPKMGSRSLEFVEQAHDFAVQNSGHVPPYLNMTEFNVDFTDAHGLWTLLNSIQQLEQGVNDTEMVAGSEAYQAALTFYGFVKTEAKKDVSGAKAIYDELKKRFPTRRRRRASEETGTDEGAS